MKKYSWVVWPCFFVVTISLWGYFGGLNAALGSGTDKFESLGSLFSGLAFVGMLCALFMQKQELSLQRKELEETREVLRQTQEGTERFAQATERYAEIEEFKQKLDTVGALLKSCSDIYDHMVAQSDYKELLGFIRIDKSNRENLERYGLSEEEINQLAQLLSMADNVKKYQDLQLDLLFDFEHKYGLDKL